MKLGRAACAGLLVLSCSTRGERAPDEQATLGGEVAARVAGQPIPLSVVAAVARAQNVPAREAARKVIDDEIAAGAARARALDKRQQTEWKLVATRGRLVADRILEEAKRKGPPTDEEVKTLSERHWVEVDRPETVRVVHAVALKPKKGATEEAAKDVAKKLHEAALAATSVADFETRTKAVPHPKGVEVVVEQLPALARDGRSLSGPMDKQFTEVAAMIAPGATSGIVESSFGWHVIRCIERLPEARMPFEARRAAFGEEVFAMRSNQALSALLKGLLARHPVEVSPSAESLMRSVQIGNEQASNP